MPSVLKQGDKVLAKWPGSRRYENATIVDIAGGASGKVYRVQYSDETFSVVKETDVKAMSVKSESSQVRFETVQTTTKLQSKSTGKANKSPTRSTGKSPTRMVVKSPVKAAGKSPGRAASKSPSRATSKSPSRTVVKSPSKTSKSPSRAVAKSPTRSTSKSPSRVTSKSSVRATSKSPARATGKSPARATSKSPARATGKSPARSTGKSPSKASGKSPGRPSGKTPSKSPSKTPGKSPARTASKSPARVANKSPSRSTGKGSESRGRKQGAAQSRSPAGRKASKSPSEARGRSKSPSKTPTSKPKKPAPKSPTKTPKPVASNASVRTPGKKSIKAKDTKQSEELFSSPDSSPVLKKRGRPSKVPGELIKNKLELIPILNKLSSKIQTLHKKYDDLEDEEEEKKKQEEEEEVEEEEDDEVDVAVRKVYSTRSKMVSKVEVNEIQASVPVVKPKETRMKAGIFGILFSILTTVALPALAVYLTLNCVRKNMDLLTVPQLPKASAFFSYKVAAVYLAFVVLQAALCALPIGRVVRGFHSQPGKPRLLYRLNGLHSLIINIGLLGLLGYLGQPVTFVCDNFLKLACTATAFSFVLSVVLYVKALFQQPSRLSLYGNTGCTPYDFQHGREVNPRLGALYDIKMAVLRSALIGWAIADISLTYKCYMLNGCVYSELVLVVSAQLLYILDLLYREEALLATAAVMHEGLGFGLIHTAFTICPFTFTVPVYYLVHHKPNLPLYCLAGMAVLFLCGLVMNRLSLASKTKAKRSPKSSQVAGSQKILISRQEKVLISSGLWGKIRHPNYISEVLMFLAWTLPCGIHTLLPYVPVLLVLLSVVRRCFHVENIMVRNYDDSYQQYKHRVPYRLCPYIF